VKTSGGTFEKKNISRIFRFDLTSSLHHFIPPPFFPEPGGPIPDLAKALGGGSPADAVAFDTGSLPGTVSKLPFPVGAALLCPSAGAAAVAAEATATGLTAFKGGRLTGPLGTTYGGG
jgi:hypothetical protein